MKVSMNHLKELVKTDVSVAELSQLFNLHSGEVEEYYKLVEANNLVVGHVVSKERHPDADKLSVCQVDIGGEISQIVCGAPNVAQGQNVIVSKPGAVLPGGFKIKQSHIRGVESNGMICSLGELGLNKKFVYTDGIHVIKEECKPGDNPLEVLNLVDEVMALDITPNRADLLSIMGVAYDTSAILNAELTVNENLKVDETDKEADIKVRIDADKLVCPAYYGRVIENIEIKESPQWLQSRLIAMGVRPINNVVDITNYVMLETGQPLHAFDYDKIETKQIAVRLAKPGEKLVTLDEQVRELNELDIVITDGVKPIALGGVMGGFETEVNDNTKTILLESANFRYEFIRRTSRRLDLRSEASIRFERKIDPKRTELALNRAANLLQELANGSILKMVEDNYVDNVSELDAYVNITTDTIEENLGFDLEKLGLPGESKVEKIVNILNRLKIENEVYNGYMKIEDLTEIDKMDENEVKKLIIQIKIPTRRQDMIADDFGLQTGSPVVKKEGKIVGYISNRYQDIVEEVGRIIGYDKLPLNLPSTITKGKLSASQIFRRDLTSKLVGLGLDEVVTYALVKEDRMNDFTKEVVKEYIKVASPMSLERHALTSSPLVSMIDVVKYNIARKNNDVFIFELSKRYTEQEKLVVSGALTGVMSHTNWQGKKEVVDFYTVKGILDSLLENLHLGHLEYAPTKAYKNLHPGQSAVIEIKQGKNVTEVGFLGKLHPEYAKKHSLKNVYVFELEIEKLHNSQRILKRVKEINKFPEVNRDIAVVLDEKVPASEVLAAVNKAGKRMLIKSEVFDLYKGAPLTETQKSLAIKLVFSDPKRTLEAKEVDQRVNEILGVLKAKFNAELR